MDAEHELSDEDVLVLVHAARKLADIVALAADCRYPPEEWCKAADAVHAARAVLGLPDLTDEEVDT